MAVIIERNEKMARAAERAKADSMLVKAERFGAYRVVNRTRQTEYQVNLWKTNNGLKLGKCSCRAGQKDQLCKHIPAAVSLHIYLARQRG